VKADRCTGGGRCAPIEAAAMNDVTNEFLTHDRC
jgi:hypothetical protein